MNTTDFSLLRANLRDEDPHQIDILWNYLRTLTEPGTTNLVFGLLFRVAEVVLTIMLLRSVSFHPFME